MSEPRVSLMIEQCDREAAADYRDAVWGYKTSGCMRAGKEDGFPLVQAFARHRLAAALPDREAEIVRWLRRNNSEQGAVGLIDRALCSQDDGPWDVAATIADAIERGAHRAP